MSPYTQPNQPRWMLIHDKCSKLKKGSKSCWHPHMLGDVNVYSQHAISVFKGRYLISPPVLPEKFFNFLKKQPF